MLEKIKLMLGLKGTTESDDILNLMIEDAKTVITIYCNRKTLPEALEYMVREIVINAFKIENDGNVSSIKRGDMQISYTTAITAGSFTDKQMKILKRFKKMRIG